MESEAIIADHTQIETELQSETDQDQSRKSNDPSIFVSTPGLREMPYPCVIRKVTDGICGKMFPSYKLHLEFTDREGEEKRIFLMAARRQKLSVTAKYSLFTDEEDHNRNGEHCIGSVNGNLLGNKFAINGKTVNRFGFDPCSKPQELAAAAYNVNLFGLRQRRMTILAADIEKPIFHSGSLLEKYRENDTDNLYVMKNRIPVWDVHSQPYFTSFNGTFLRNSQKNFQIVQEHDPNFILMRLGKISDNKFAMDYRYPLTAVQAFGIALTSLHGKLACG